jgi:hypothetical protein
VRHANAVRTSAALVVFFICTAAIGADEPSTQPSTNPSSPSSDRATLPRAAFNTAVRGKVTKIDPVDMSITIAAMDPLAPGDAPTERTFNIDENTRITVAKIDATRQGPNGETISMWRNQPGSIADMQVGQDVLIRGEGGIAAMVSVMPASILSRGATLQRRSTTRPFSVTQPTTGAFERPTAARIIRLDPKSITLRLRAPGAFGPTGGFAAPTTGPTEHTYTINENTRFYVGVIASERMNPQGRTIRSISSMSGRFEDLQVGQTVQVRFDGDVLTFIMTMPIGRSVSTAPTAPTAR